MKKAAVVIVMLSLAHSVFAADFSFGGGALAGYTFTRYTLHGGSVESVQIMDRFDYGGFVFFDASYVVFAIMYQAGNGTFRENMILDDSSLADTTGTGNEAVLGLSLLGKYPFTVNERIAWYPMFGVEYHIALIQRRTTAGGLVYNRDGGRFMEDRDKDNNTYPLSAWNSLWIQIGAGLDYSLSGPLFLRSELLFGFRLPTSYEMGALEVIENLMNIQDPRLGGLTGKPALRISAGFRF